MKSILKKFVSDEQGLETVEYALIAALITIAAIVAITNVGGSVNTKFEQLNTKLGGTN